MSRQAFPEIRHYLRLREWKRKGGFLPGKIYGRCRLSGMETENCFLPRGRHTAGIWYRDRNGKANPVPLRASILKCFKMRKLSGRSGGKNIFQVVFPSEEPFCVADAVTFSGAWITGTVTVVTVAGDSSVSVPDVPRIMA